MRVTVLSPDLSSNCLGRALVLAEILALDHEVRVLGPLLGSQLWPPAQDHPAELVAVEGGPWPGFISSVRALMNEISGDVVVAVKPRFPSFGVALLARRSRGIPVVLDMDDDETALRPVPSRPLHLAGDLLASDGGASRWVMARARGQADALTVASWGLQNRYGGHLVRHAKDTDRLRPGGIPGSSLRKDLHLGTEPLVLFLGTPRPWKGVEDAARAVGSLPFPATLLVVGADETQYARMLASLPRVRTHPMVPISTLPAFLEAADLVVIPQRQGAITRFQVPSKLFDAMALARPILATAVSDIPRILGEDRGVVVPPERVTRLATAMRRILQDPEGAGQMGARARAWCVEHASLRAAREPLNRALERARARRGS